MKKALIDPNGLLIQVESIAFPVAAPFQWVDVADDVSPETHIWNGAAAVPAPAPTLDQLKAAQIALINAGCQAALLAIVAGYPDLEIATWPQQYVEAQTYTTNPTPMLSAIASASGRTVADVAATVLDKAAAYVADSGAVVGRRIALTAQINAATDAATVNGVVW